MTAKAWRWKAASAERVGGSGEQQDSVGCFAADEGSSCLVVVADGLGGHRGGSLASQTLLEIAERNWNACNGSPQDPARFLEDLCQQAHDEIHRRGRERALHPHTTVVALVIRGSRGFWIHVGDSRLYHFQCGELLGRTRDHSLVQLLVDTGEVSEADSATHPDRKNLLRSIGGEDPPKTSHGTATLHEDDRFVLCSDGFWEAITVDEMAAALLAPQLDEAFERLAELAAQRGGARGDNIAVAAVRLEEAGCAPT